MVIAQDHRQRGTDNLLASGVHESWASFRDMSGSLGPAWPGLGQVS